jgi:SAM-dependent methyltransferase
MTIHYDDLAAFCTPPAPFSRYTTDRLWTDPHIGRQMLAFHLNPDVDAASRRPAAIDALVGWLDERFGLIGQRVLDLGCGPGLYAERIARRGARVTGFDFSAVSIGHARASAKAAGLDIDYVVGDYHADPLPGPVDLAILIYGDYCAMSPAQRRAFLAKVKTSLAPGGCFVFDVYSPGQFAALGEALEFGHRLMGGFWAEGDYFGFRKSFRYEDERISLDRYLIVAPDRQFEIYNWMQYFDPAGIARELAEAGFEVDDCLDIGTGAPWVESAAPFAVVARPR